MFSDFPVCDTIQKRHSVRTFDTRPLDGETLGKLTALTAMQALELLDAQAGKTIFISGGPNKAFGQRVGASPLMRPTFSKSTGCAPRWTASLRWTRSTPRSKRSRAAAPREKR